MFPRLYECKDCGGFNGYRSRPKNLTERFLLPLLFFDARPAVVTASSGPTNPYS